MSGKADQRNDIPLNGYLTTEEMAHELRVHRTTLAKWRMQRRGPPFVKMGNRVLYNVERFRDWLEQSEISPIPEQLGHSHHSREARK